MLITPIPNAAIPIPPDTTNRTNNPTRVHVTEILNYIDEVTYGAKSAADFTADGWDSQALCEAGFNYERMLEIAWTDRLGARCGEIEREGIVGSPDGVAFDPIGNFDRPWVIEEYKFSWQSSATAFQQDSTGNFLKPKWQRFINQAKSYCVLWGEREPEYGSECCRVLYRILFVNGNYKDQRGAQYKEWLVEFSQDELAEWWERMKQIRDRLMEKKVNAA